MTLDLKYIAQNNSYIEAFLKRRGLTSQDAEYLFNPKAAHQHDPFLLKGVDRFIDILHSKKGEQIAIIPDYDADGILSGTIARVGLYLLGFGDAYIHPPSTAHGYGLSEASVDAAIKSCPDAKVIITTDNGSNADSGVRYAQSKGLTVLITDHHLAPKDSMIGDARVNPNGHGDTTYPYKSISGTTVIYKVLEAYKMKYGIAPEYAPHFSSLLLPVGMSAISDVMPMLDENRYFVANAVSMFDRFTSTHSTDRLYAYDDSPLGQYYRGIDALVHTLNRHNKLKYGINADTFGFTLGPILNSPRRMIGESKIAFDLFMQQRHELQPGTGSVISDKLFDMNEGRKAHVNGLTQRLFEHLEASGLPAQQHVVFNAAMGGGVAGLLAGKFTTKFGLPSIAFAVPNGPEGAVDIDVSNQTGYVSGSARAPGGFDIHGVLSQIDEHHPGLLGRWGGHAQAAGVSVKAKHYTEFKRVFTGYVAMAIMQAVILDRDESGGITLPLAEYMIETDAFQDVRGQYTTDPDVVVVERAAVERGGSLWSAAEAFESLAPFGQGFPAPTFGVIIDLEHDVKKTMFMGTEKQHVKFTLHNGLVVLNWHGAKLFEDGAVKRVLATGELSINEFNGYRSLQIIAQDVQVMPS